MQIQGFFPTTDHFQALSPRNKITYLEQLRRQKKGGTEASVVVFVFALMFLPLLWGSGFTFVIISSVAFCILLFLILATLRVTVGYKRCLQLLISETWQRKEYLPVLLEVADILKDPRAATWSLHNLPNALSDALQEQYVTLTPVQQTNLFRMLGVSAPIEGAYALLAYLDRQGNSQCLPILRTLASGNGRAARDPALQQAAGYCLMRVEQRLAAQQVPATLLRASNAPVNTEALLHPVEDVSPQSPPEEMLRPASISKSTES